MIDSLEWEMLCSRLQQSDDHAFERIFRMLRDDLLRYVLSIVRDDPTAHDLVQDVFVSLWDLRSSLDPSRPLRPYIFRMARNRAYRHLRDERLHARKQMEMGSDNHAASELQDMAFDATSLDRRLGRWVQQLPDRQREAIVLTRYHGLSHREAASVMGISPRTVNNHIARALDAIRRQLEAYDFLVEET